MKLNLLIFAAVMICAVGLTLYTNSAIMLPPEPGQSSQPTVGRMVPAFSFEVLDSDEMNIRDLGGKVVLINFWASWCAPCIEEFPALYRLAEEMPDTLAIVAVSADEKKDELRRFLDKTGIRPDNFHIVWDEEKSISQDLFQTVRLPETVILSPEQRMVDKVIGAAEWDDDEMKARLQALQD